MPVIGRVCRAVLAGVGAAAEVLWPADVVAQERVWPAGRLESESVDAAEPVPTCLIHGEWCAGPACWWIQSQSPAHGAGPVPAAAAGATDPAAVIPPAAAGSSSHHLISGNTPTPVRSANPVQSGAGVGPTAGLSWADWATPRIRDVLRQHFNARTLGGPGVEAALVTEAANAIADRLETACLAITPTK